MSVGGTLNVAVLPVSDKLESDIFVPPRENQQERVGLFCTKESQNLNERNQTESLDKG